ncbi:MAG: ABC transporter substrate-binding protein [Planctomycetes bacterium]|nr:ABC transporter substrate-binding protein [Planctomycetota bacterium]
MRTRSLLLALSLLAFSSAGRDSAGAEPDRRKPFFDARKQRSEYAGPGRETSTSEEEVEEVLIGYFGPSDPDDPIGGDLWKAAQLAIAQVNSKGGYRGKPFRLVPAWSENPWGTGVKLVTRLAYDQRVWAIVGGIDGPTTHLAEQVVAKARLPLVSPISTDKTVNLANVPWMFSLAPGDHLLAPPLAAEIAARIGDGHFMIVSADDHDSRLLNVELKKALSQRRLAAKREAVIRQGRKELRHVVAQVTEVAPDVAVIIADADDSARLVMALRAEGFKGSILGGPAMGRRQFMDKAGDAAKGVVFPLLWHTSAKPGSFAHTFKQRYGHSPDYAAAHTYDAVRLLVEAIRRAGLSRARIGDAVRELSPWTGVTGTVRWDGLGSNTRAAELGTITNGRVVSLSKHPSLYPSTPR